jgi:hypothetical protein
MLCCFIQNTYAFNGGLKERTGKGAHMLCIDGLRRGCMCVGMPIFAAMSKCELPSHREALLIAR